MNDHLHPLFRAILAPYAPADAHSAAVTEALAENRPFSDALHRWTIVRPPVPPANERGSLLEWGFVALQPERDDR